MKMANAALVAMALMLPASVLAQAPAAAPGQQTADPPATSTAPAVPAAPTPGSSPAPGQAAAAPRPNDFPTQARVEYVYACMKENAGPPMQEMFYKCICAADAVAARVSHERWVELSIFNAARPMAGERGAYLRERKDSPAMLRAYRELQASARESCFIRSPESR